MFPAHISPNGDIQTSTIHCRNTAELAKGYLSRINLGNLAYLAGILHDCGKFTDEFSDYIHRAAEGKFVRKGEVIHSFAGVRFMLRDHHKLLSPKGKRMDLLTSELIAIAVGSHHGLFDCIDLDGQSGFSHRLLAQTAYDDTAIRNFCAECMTASESDALFSAAVLEITALLPELRSIIASSGEGDFYLSLTARLLTSAVVDGDRTDTATFIEGIKVPRIKADSELWSDCLSDLEHYLESFQSDEGIGKARRELSEQCLHAGEATPGVFRLNIPTGGGKTLSGLRFALRHAQMNGMKRIILLSPLLSILDQNAKSVRTALNRDDIILEHHSNIIHEADGDDADMAAYNRWTQTWDKPIVISTLVQFLNTLFSGKMSAVRRFHALTESVIIIDEVQTVPGKMLTLFNLAVNFLAEVCHSTVVLCSATQPEVAALEHGLRRKITDIVPQNVLQEIKPVFKRTELVDIGMLPEQDIPEQICKLCRNHNSILVICNKKDEARRLFAAMQASATDKYLCHLSAGMCQMHRMRTLEALKVKLQNKEGVICIATQVIEAGVDVSFDCVVRYVAGMDNIIQAAGRCNRNGELLSPAPVYVLRCGGEDLRKLPEMESAKLATEILLDSFAREPERYANDLSSDLSVSAYYHNLYKSWTHGYCDYYYDKYQPSIYKLLSDNKDCLPDNKEYGYMMAQAFKTAGQAFQVLDDAGYSVIVPYAEGEAIAEKLEIAILTKANISEVKSLLDCAKPYTVSIPQYQLEDICKQGGIKKPAEGRIYILSKDYYDDNIGVVSSKKEESECNILIL